MIIPEITYLNQKNCLISQYSLSSLANYWVLIVICIRENGENQRLHSHLQSG